MKLDLFVSADQARDFAGRITVGDRIPIELMGYWGGALGPEVQSMAAYQSSAGMKVLRKTGLVEHAFCGQILDLRSLEDFGAPGHTYQECLLDCGIGVILISVGLVTVSAENLDDPTRSDLTRGQYLSGVMMLDGRISFRYPNLIEHMMDVEVTSVGILDLSPRSAELGSIRQVESVETWRVNQPLILGVETIV